MPYVRIGQRKVLKRRRTSSAPPILVSAPGAPSAKHKQWTENQMKTAIKAGKSGVNRAAMDHGIPATTLKDRLSGRTKENSRSGPSRYLNENEENELSIFVKDCASIGYGKTRKEVMRIVETHAKDKGLLRKDSITQRWWRNFVSRQGDLALRKGDNTAHVRKDAINSETINHYFDLLEDTLKENGLMHSPSQIYNVDESGMPLDPKALLTFGEWLFPTDPLFPHHGKLLHLLPDRPHTSPASSHQPLVDILVWIGMIFQVQTVLTLIASMNIAAIDVSSIPV